MTGRSRHPFEVVTCVLAERLCGCGPSDELHALVHSGDVNWERVVAHASAQFVLPAFAASVRDLGLVASLEPELAEFLDTVHGASIERNRELYDQLVELASTLNQVGIEPVLLKGANRLIDGLYPDTGWRLMFDLDVLVTKPDFVDAIQQLQETGYVGVRAADPLRKDVKLRRRGCASVEVHQELFWTARKQQLLGGAEVIASSRPVVVDGATVRLPSAEHQIAHLIGHSQIGHFNHVYGRIALRDRLEAAALAHWAPEGIAWEAVHARFAAAGYRRPLLVFLLSLRDCDLCAVPIEGHVDVLTDLQQRRIALQARSPTTTRISLVLGWYIVLVKMQLIERSGGQGKLGKSIKEALVDREKRQRMAETLLRRPPSW